MRGVSVKSTPPIPWNAGPQPESETLSLYTTPVPVLMKSPDCSTLHQSAATPAPIHGTTFDGMYASRPTDRPRGARYAFTLTITGTRCTDVLCSISWLLLSTKFR